MAKHKAKVWSFTGAPLSLNLHLFTNPETLGTVSFWIFMEALLHSHDCLAFWPLVTELNVQPITLLRGQ